MKKRIGKSMNVLVAGAVYMSVALCAQTVRAGDAYTVKSYDGLTLDNLPSAAEVIQASLNALPESLGEFNDWGPRMRWSTLLPQFQARYRLFQDIADRYETIYRYDDRYTSGGRNEKRETDRVAADPLDSYNDTYSGNYSEGESYRGISGPFSNNEDDELIWADDIQFTATWNLNNLIFNDDEIQAAQAARFVAEFRIKYMQNIAALYGKLQTAMENLARSPDNKRAKDQRDIHAAMLDELTDEFISQSIPEQRPSSAPGANGTSSYQTPLPRSAQNGNGQSADADKEDSDLAFDDVESSDLGKSRAKPSAPDDSDEEDAMFDEDEKDDDGENN